LDHPDLAWNAIGVDLNVQYDNAGLRRHVKIRRRDGSGGSILTSKGAVTRFGTRNAPVSVATNGSVQLMIAASLGPRHGLWKKMPSW
jgi:hypothetical protein